MTVKREALNSLRLFEIKEYWRDVFLAQYLWSKKKTWQVWHLLCCTLIWAKKFKNFFSARDQIP